VECLLLIGAPFLPEKTSANPAKLIPPLRRSRTPLTLSSTMNFSTNHQLVPVFFPEMPREAHNQSGEQFFGLVPLICAGIRLA
jgi:hypothetical protein